MNFEIEFTDVADLEVQNIVLWIMGRSPEGAKKWQDGFENAVNSLAAFPRRCPFAPENAMFTIDVRQLLYGGYRILFILVGSDRDGDEDTVRILHVRHGSRRLLDEELDDA
jgi:plasmid stabilization system protein ParE